MRFAALIALAPYRIAAIPMRMFISLLAAWLVGLPAVADQKGEYEIALTKWHNAAVHNYTFIYQWHGAVVVAPACADARIRVRVRDGVGSPPTVVQGNSRCPRGTRGVKNIGFPVPATIDEAFAEMLRYIANSPIPVRITTSYDETYGVPTSYFVEKLELEDNDEGFRITSFAKAK